MRLKGVSSRKTLVEIPKQVLEKCLRKNMLKAKDDKIKQLYKEIKKLKAGKEKLIVQLVEMEELKDENKRFRESLDKIKTIK